MYKKLKNNIKIYVGQAVLQLLIKTIFFTFLIYNLKTAWPTKISMPFLSSLANLLSVACSIFQQKVLIFLRSHTKHANVVLPYGSSS